MIETELLSRSALRLFEPPSLPDGSGRRVLVAARAGTGKTALLVQVAIDALLRGMPVLHVSVGETLPHVKRWYHGVYRDLAAGLPIDAVRATWEPAERRRLIMVFRDERFSAERLLERLRGLESAGVFAPRLVVADGLSLEPDLRADLETLGQAATERGFDLWLAGRTPGEADDLEGVAEPLASLFEAVVALEPSADTVTLRWIRGAPPGLPRLLLDPVTLLLTPA